MDPLGFTLLITPNDWTPLPISESFLAYAQSIERLPTDSPLSFVIASFRIDFAIPPTPPRPADHITAFLQNLGFRG
jgi:hypothetical protein